MMFSVDEAACVSEKKTEAMCSECVRNINMVDVRMGQEYGELEITKVKNFATGATTKCSGVLKKDS